MAVSPMQSDAAASSANPPGRYGSNPPSRPASYHTQQPSAQTTAPALLRAPSARSRSVDKRSTADNVYGNLHHHRDITNGLVKPPTGL
jgi:hypothetical protein